MSSILTAGKNLLTGAGKVLTTLAKTPQRIQKELDKSGIARLITQSLPILGIQSLSTLGRRIPTIGDLVKDVEFIKKEGLSGVAREIGKSFKRVAEPLKLASKNIRAVTKDFIEAVKATPLGKTAIDKIGNLPVPKAGGLRVKDILGAVDTLLEEGENLIDKIEEVNESLEKNPVSTLKPFIKDALKETKKDNPKIDIILKGLEQLERVTAINNAGI